MNGYVAAGYLATFGVLFIYVLRTLLRERKLRKYFRSADVDAPK